jgi:hypothetical protein
MVVDMVQILLIIIKQLNKTRLLIQRLKNFYFKTKKI